MVGDAGGPILGLELLLELGPALLELGGRVGHRSPGGTGGYLYAWSELDVSPWEWFRLGVAAQRTRVFHTPREVIFGPLVGVTVWKLDSRRTGSSPGGARRLSSPPWP